MPNKTQTKDAYEIETFDFHPKISELISLIGTIPYLNKEIFLRELISNSNDALDKIHIKAPFKLYNSEETYINIISNKNNHTLTIIDTGIGMTKIDLIKNLGTIPKYDNDNFMKTLQNEDDMPLGQFGMGFYSVFLVADKVTVISKYNNDGQYVWESRASKSFTIRYDKYGELLARGTKIILHIKTDQLQYLEAEKIKEIVKKHSQYIEYPIKLITYKECKIHIMGNKAKREQKKIIIKKYTEEEEINNVKPIWTRNPDEITDEEHNKYFRERINNNYTNYLYKDFYIEDKLKLTVLLYVPRYTPINILKRQNINNMKLYINQQFITDNCDELIPEYLNFITGVVNSEDLSVYISRNMLKQDILENIRNHLTQKCFEIFDDIAKDKEIYTSFYECYKNKIKLAIQRDNINRNKLMQYLRYYTSASGDERCSLSDYVSRMKDNQKYIYYIICYTDISKEDFVNNSKVQEMKKRGFEVIRINNNRLNRYIIQMMFDEKQFMLIYNAKYYEDWEENPKENKTKYENFRKVNKNFLKN